MPARPASWRTTRNRYLQTTRELSRLARPEPTPPPSGDPCPACDGEGMKYRDVRKLRGTPCFTCNGSGHVTPKDGTP